MNEHDLFKAIGAVDDQQLLECEAPTSRRRLRPLGKALLLAAVIAVLSISAMATPSIYNALKGSDLRWNNHLYNGFPEDQCGGYELFLDIDADENAPRTLEQPYIPTAILSTDTGYCFCYEDLFLYWRGEYRFEQYVLPENTDTTYNALIRTIPNAKVITEIRNYAGFDVLEVIFDDTTNGERISNRQLYWSDGSYLYYLTLPLDADAEQILSTMTAFTDIDQYLHEPIYKPSYCILKP